MEKIELGDRDVAFILRGEDGEVEFFFPKFEDSEEVDPMYVPILAVVMLYGATAKGLTPLDEAVWKTLDGYVDVNIKAVQDARD